MTATSEHPLPPLRSGSARLARVDLTGPGGRLEAVVNEGAPDAPFTALVCHPHPKGGGTLHNKVVYHAMKALNAPEWGLGWPVMRFNFRGTGRSQGTYDGKAEAEDVLAGRAWLESQYGLPVILVGFSFGAAMALRSLKLDGRGVRRVIALGLPVQADGRQYDYSFVKAISTPKLFVSGDGDEYAPPKALEQVVAGAADPKRLVFIPGADHFFHGQLRPMQRAITGWLKEQVA
jgi:alpha/beta superfamily hydrolase